MKRFIKKAIAETIIEMAQTLTAHFCSLPHSISSSKELVRDERLTTENAVNAAQYWNRLVSVMVKKIREFERFERSREMEYELKENI
jgi:hypothetical protein